MGFYSDSVVPRLVTCACGTKPILKQREKIVPRASGRVLEVGIGSGLNLAYYDPDKVEKVWGLEPSPEMVALAQEPAVAVEFEVEFIGLPGEEIPL